VKLSISGVTARAYLKSLKNPLTKYLSWTIVTLTNDSTRRASYWKSLLARLSRKTQLKRFASMQPWHNCATTDRRTMQGKASAQVWTSQRYQIMQTMIAGSRGINCQTSCAWASRLEVEAQAWSISTQTHLFLSTRSIMPIKIWQFKGQVDIRPSWLQTSTQAAPTIRKCKVTACKWVSELCPLVSLLLLKAKKSAEAKVGQLLKDDHLPKSDKRDEAIPSFIFHNICQLVSFISKFL